LPCWLCEQSWSAGCNIVRLPCWLCEQSWSAGCNIVRLPCWFYYIFAHISLWVRWTGWYGFLKNFGIIPKLLYMRRACPGMFAISSCLTARREPLITFWSDGCRCLEGWCVWDLSVSDWRLPLNHGLLRTVVPIYPNIGIIVPRNEYWICWVELLS